MAVTSNIVFNATGITGILNLDGGVLAANAIYNNGTTTTGIVNFNGGTLRTTANGGNYLGSSIGNTNSVTAAYVYGGGAKIDTNGNNETIYNNLLAPTGNGVSSIAISGTGYAGAPYVKITGDGKGATAVANLDASGNITGITITNPGVGYTSGAATLIGGGGAVTSGTTINLAANTSGGLSKIGFGTLTLAGTNTYTGATTVYGGTLVLSNTNSYTGTTTINPTAGLTLNFSAATAAQTNIINPASTLSLGGALILTGSAGATNSQTFAGTNLLPGASTIVLTSATSNPLAVNLGSTFTHTTGGTVDLTLPAGTQSASNGILATATNSSFPGGTNTIIGGWATVSGTTWAVGGTSGASTNISGLTTYNSGLAAGTDVEAGNLGTIAPATMTINSIRFNTAGTTTINLGGPLTIASGGILRTSNASGDVNINNSTITAGNGSDLTVINNQTNNWITIASQIIGNIGLTKSGAGSLNLTGNNTFNGTVTLNAGLLYIGNSRALGTGGAGSLVFNGGTLEYDTFGNAGSFSQDVSSKIAPVAFGEYAAINTNSASVTFGSPISGSGGLQKSGNGLLDLAATNTYTGQTYITGGYLGFSSLSNLGSNGSGGLKFQFGGLRWDNGNTADISGLSLSYGGDTYFDTNGNNVVFNNSVAAGSFNWIFKLGLGTLDLKNTLGQNGSQGFILQGGTVNLDFSSGAVSSNILTSGNEFRWNGGTLLMTGNAGATDSQTIGAWNFGVNGNGAGTLKFAQNGATALNLTLGTMNSRAVGNTLNIIPQTAGTITYTGGSASTILTSGGVAYATVNGSDWAASNAANNAIVGLSAGGGTGYTNSTSTTLTGNADIASGVATTTLAANATPTTLRFNQNQATTVNENGYSLSTDGILVTPAVATAGSIITGGTLTTSNNNNQDLVVFQNSGQNFTIGSVIANINGANGLTKSGTGNLILSGNNTYTGTTNVNEGTLTFTGIRTTAAGTINVNGGTLAVTGGLLNTAGNSINIGASTSSVGSFNLSGGTVFTTANAYLGNNQSGQGIINQSGGNFIDGGVLTIGSGPGTYGALNLSGGTFTKLGSELWLGTGGSALVNISGNGVMNLTNGAWMNPSRVAGANYTAFVLSGNGVLNTGNGVHEIWGQNGGTVIVTMKDNAWLNIVNGALYLGYNGGSGILNLAGGVTSLNYIQTSTGDVQNSSFVNFNGGILQATNSSQGSFISGLTAATIYGGGATIDTMVFGNNVTIPQALLAPTGNGISALAATGNTSGFLSAPIVQITGGGGTGASAIANIDGNGNLTGFTIVSPGSGYTSAPTVTLVGGGVADPTVAATLASVVGTGGGLTKIGQGSLTLGSTANTYTGATNVTNGSLIYAPAGSASQSFGALAFNGGDGTVQSTFNTGTDSVTFSSLSARSAGATQTFIVSGGTPTGATPTNKIVLTGQAGGFIDQGSFYGTSTGGNYAWYDATNNYVRGINYGTDAGSVTSGAATSLSGTYVQTTGAVSAQTTGTFATLNISGNNGPFNLANGATLTVNGILKTGNNGWYNITGGNGIQAVNNAELVIRVDQGGDGLHIYNSILANGNNALTKTGAGALWLSGSDSYTGPTYLSGGVLTFDTPYALGTGSIVFKGGTLQINGGYNGPVVDLSSRFSAIGANLNAVVDTNGYDATFNSAITGAGSFQKNGTGTLFLAGTNTFAGGLNLVGGYVNFSSLSNLGTGKITFGSGNGGGVQYAFGNTADLSTQNVFLYGNATLDTNGNNVTLANPIGATGAGGLTKIGTGTLRFTANNIYQGTTTVNEGAVQLDFSTTPGANQASLLSTNTGLALGGGTFILTGAAGATNSQSMNGTTFNAGASNIQLNANATSNPLLLSLNGLTRNTGGTVDFTLPSGTQGSSNGATTSSTTLVSNSVLASAASNGIAYATVGGSNWASLSGNNIIPLASYNTDAFGTSTFNTDVTTSDSPVLFTVNTLRFSGAGSNSALTLASGTSVVSTGGLLVTSAASGATIGGTGAIASGAGKELVIIDNGALTVNTPIADSSSGASVLTLSGTGTTTLNGTNTYTGATYVNSGKVVLGGSNTLNNALYVNGGTLQVSGTLNAGTRTISVANTSGARGVLSIVAGGNLNFGTGALLVGTQNGGANVGVVNQSGGTFIQSTAGSQQFALGNGVDSYGAYNLSGGTASVNEATIGFAGVGLLAQTSGTFTATQFLNFDRAAGSIGVGNISGGTLVGPANNINVGFSGRGELNVSGSAYVNNAGHSIVVAGGAAGYNVGIVNLLGGNLLTNAVQELNATTSTGIFNFSGGTLTANAGSTTFLQGLTAAYVNGAFGSYAGGAVINTNNQAVTIAQNLLAPTGNGVSLSTLAVSGSNFLSAPVIQLVGGGGVGATAVANIDSNGNLTGITITNPGVGYTSAPTVEILGGGGQGDTISGSLALAANTSGGLTVSGSGTLTLTGASTYTGATSVSAGTKLVVSGSLSGTTALSVAATAELNVNGGIKTASTTALSGILSGMGTLGAVNATGGTIAPGSATGNANGIGTLNTGSLSLDGSSHLAIEVGRTVAGAGTLSSDQVNVTGSVTLASGADLQLSLATGQFNPVAGDILFLVINDGADAVNGVFTQLNGVATNLAEGSKNISLNGVSYQISYQANFGTTNSANFGSALGKDIAFMAVPEPSTWAMLVGGFGLLMNFQRARSRRTSKK